MHRSQRIPCSLGWVVLASLIGSVSLACGGADSPSIRTFEATPSTLEVGEKAQLQIAYTGGQGSVSPEVGPVSSGQQVDVAPASTTVYTLEVAGARAQATVRVNPGLRVRIEGLPAGLAGNVRISGPDGFEQAVTGTQAIPKLKAGRYTVTATAVNDASGGTRHPLRLMQTVNLATTGAEVVVRYPPPVERVTLPNQGVIEFVFIPPGSFVMGREPRPDDVDNMLKPYPVHGVTLAKGFYMGRYPVTWGQWLALRPEDLQWGSFKNREPEAPIFYVSYIDIKRDFLPSIAKAVPNLKFRLPSEAEWEYALRAGSTTRYFWGEDYTRLSEFAWTWDGVGSTPSMPKVGGKNPNPWGLYDMFTALTWLEDWEQRSDYQGAPVDGSPWIIDPYDPFPFIRIRGAHFFEPAYETYNGSPRPNEIFESALRFGGAGPTFSSPWLSFRLVLEAKD